MGAESIERIQDLLEEQQYNPLTDTSPLVNPEWLRALRRGKVRDIYYFGNRLLIVTTDRISTFDAVHPNGITGKGIIINQMSLAWLEILAGIVPDHLLISDIEEFPEPFKNIKQLGGKSMIVERLDMFPVECVVRGYITGSAWEEYKIKGSICGIELPKGLLESQRIENQFLLPLLKQ